VRPHYLFFQVVDGDVHCVQHREVAVDQLVDELEKQVVRPLAQHALFVVGDLFATTHLRQRRLMDRRDVVAADDEIHLRRRESRRVALVYEGVHHQV